MANIIIGIGFILVLIWGIGVNKRLKNLEKVVKHHIVD